MGNIYQTLIRKAVLPACLFGLLMPLQAEQISAQTIAPPQELSGLARLDMSKSRIADRARGVSINLALSQGVPYRVFSLTDPARLVVDFREIDWHGVTKQALLTQGRAKDVRFGGFRPGWSRLVIDLAAPLALEVAEMRIDKDTGEAVLNIELTPVTEEEFVRLSGAPSGSLWDRPRVASISNPALNTSLKVGPKPVGEGPLVVVLDAGHGGIDPGAQRDGVAEKDLMLTLAREIKETLIRSGGFRVFMTRDDDTFVALERRIAIAHDVGAQVFVSLHADILATGQGTARGTVIHTLSPEASDVASEKLAERHNRADILAGIDLSGTDDVVADVLLDLARQETQPRADRLARVLVQNLQNVGGPLNNKPLRSGGFSVLKAADVVSVLIEVGFMSSPRDLENLRNPEWRAGIADGIRDGLLDWVAQDAALSDLIRQ